MDRETVRELLAAYALGALTPDESRELEATLRDWPEGRAELGRFVATADALALIPEEEHLPLGLEGRIIARARAQREPGRRFRPARLIPAAPRRRPWLMQTLAAGFAALAMIFGVLLFTDEDAAQGRWVDLGSTEARAYVTNYRDRPVAVAFRDLVPLPADHVYQLWRLHESTAGERRVTPEATFTPDATGAAAVALRLRDPDPLVGFALSVEPLGGSDTPADPTSVLPFPPD